MNQLEQKFLNLEAGSSEPRLTLRTYTRADVGLWWRRRPVWLCVLDSELLLFAIGRRAHSEKIPLADCPDTHYNPTSGELIIEPGELLRFQRLRMPPSDALKVLDHFKSHSSNSTPEN